MERRKLLGMVGASFALMLLPIGRLFQYLKTRREEEHEVQVAEIRAKGGVVARGLNGMYLSIENGDPELLDRWGHSAPAVIAQISASAFVVVLSPTELREFRKTLDAFLLKLTVGSVAVRPA